MRKLGGVWGDKIVRKTIKSTGCTSKFFSNDKQTASDLGLVATNKIIEEQKINPVEIGVIIFVSQTPDYKVPATAMIFHKELACDKNCIVFDVNLGCSGFAYGIYLVSSLLQGISKKYGLLIVGDCSSKLIDRNERAGSILFGDGVSAVMIKKEEGSFIRGTMLTDGSRYHAIMVPAGGLRHPVDSELGVYPVMDGVGVFNFSTNDVVNDLIEYENLTGKSTADYDSIVLHQANIAIIDRIKKKLNATDEQVPVSIDRYGNTSGASVPLTLCDHYGEQNKKVTVLMSGFGVGLSCGIIDTEIDTSIVYPIITSDFIYDDGLDNQED